MIFIVDAYNVLKQIVKSSYVDIGVRKSFINLVVKFASKTNNYVELVFDGGDYFTENIPNGAEYMEILSSIPVEEDVPEYARRQWSDMEYLAKMENTCLKVSWMMPLKKGQKHLSDEVYFDEGFKARFKRPYSFVYNNAALTFDPSRPNVCPYTSPQGEQRLLISADQNAESKLVEFLIPKSKSKEKALAQTGAVAMFVEKTFGIGLTSEAAASIGARVNAII